MCSNQSAKFSVWRLQSTGDVKVFAGKEESLLDGPVKTCRFRQPTGIATEFNSVVYVCDAQTNCIKLLSRMYYCARFLRAIGALYEAFSIHNKAALYETKTTSEAIDLVPHCKTTLEQYEYEIRTESKITGALFPKVTSLQKRMTLFS